MRRSIATCGPRFSMRRMVKEYSQRLYMPALHSGRAAAADGHAGARALADWKRHVRENWAGVNLQLLQGAPAQAAVGDSFDLSVRLWPGRLSARDLAVELVVGGDGDDDFIAAPAVIAMQPVQHHDDGSIDYQGVLSPGESGRLAVGIRVRPQHPGMVHVHELGLARWA